MAMKWAALLNQGIRLLFERAECLLRLRLVVRRNNRLVVLIVKRVPYGVRGVALRALAGRVGHLPGPVGVSTGRTW